MNYPPHDGKIQTIPYAPRRPLMAGTRGPQLGDRTIIFEIDTEVAKGQPILHACGHTQLRRLFGPERIKKQQYAWYASQGCDRCEIERKAHRALPDDTQADA